MTDLELVTIGRSGQQGQKSSGAEIVSFSKRPLPWSNSVTNISYVVQAAATGASRVASLVYGVRAVKEGYDLQFREVSDACQTTNKIGCEFSSSDFAEARLYVGITIGFFVLSELVNFFAHLGIDSVTKGRVRNIQCDKFESQITLAPQNRNGKKTYVLSYQAKLFYTVLSSFYLLLSAGISLFALYSFDQARGAQIDNLVSSCLENRDECRKALTPLDLYYLFFLGVSAFPIGLSFFLQFMNKKGEMQYQDRLHKTFEMASQNFMHLLRKKEKSAEAQKSESDTSDDSDSSLDDSSSELDYTRPPTQGSAHASLYKPIEVFLSEAGTPEVSLNSGYGSMPVSNSDTPIERPISVSYTDTPDKVLFPGYANVPMDEDKEDKSGPSSATQNKGLSEFVEKEDQLRSLFAEFPSSSSGDHEDAKPRSRSRAPAAFGPAASPSKKAGKPYGVLVDKHEPHDPKTYDGLPEAARSGPGTTKVSREDRDKYGPNNLQVAVDKASEKEHYAGLPEIEESESESRSSSSE